MVRAAINIVIGLVMIIGGLSGNLALRGTGSGELLAGLGAAILLWGGYLLVKARG